MTDVFGTLTSAPENVFNNWIKPHLYVIGTVTVGVYFFTPYIGPTIQNFLGISTGATNAIVAGSFAGVGVGILESYRYKP